MGNCDFGLGVCGYETVSILLDIVCILGFLARETL